jgi:hypothetical protein
MSGTLLETAPDNIKELFRTMQTVRAACARRARC